VLFAVGCGGQHEAPCDGPRDARLVVLAIEDEAPFPRLLADRVRADPGARAAGIDVADDVWQQDVMRGDLPVDTIRHRSPFVTGPSAEAIAAYLARHDGASVIPDGMGLEYGPQGGSSPGWRSFAVTQTRVIDQGDVVGATIEPGVAGPGVQLVLTLTPEGKARFAAFTRGHVGHKIAVSLDGVVANAPIIHGPIEGGRVGLSLTRPEAEALRRRLGCR
jgi:hypothetical protein